MKIGFIVKKIITAIETIEQITEHTIRDDSIQKMYFLRETVNLGGWLFHIRDATNGILSNIKDAKILINNIWYDEIKAIIWYRNRILHDYLYQSQLDSPERIIRLNELLELKNKLKGLKPLLIPLSSVDEDMIVAEKQEEEQEARTKAYEKYDLNLADFMAIAINEIYYLDKNILRLLGLSLQELDQSRSDFKKYQAYTGKLEKAIATSQPLFLAIELHYININQILRDYYELFEAWPNGGKISAQARKYREELTPFARNIILDPGARRRGATHPELPNLDKATIIDYICAFHQVKSYCKKMLNYIMQLGMNPNKFKWDSTGNWNQAYLMQEKKQKEKREHAEQKSDNEVYNTQSHRKKHKGKGAAKDQPEEQAYTVPSTIANLTN
jgi:hypothetical protein